MGSGSPKSSLPRGAEGGHDGDCEVFSGLIGEGHDHVQGVSFKTADRVVDHGSLSEKTVGVGAELDLERQSEAEECGMSAVKHGGIWDPLGSYTSRRRDLLGWGSWWWGRWGSATGFG